MHNYATRWSARVQELATPRPAERYTHTYLQHAPAAESSDGTDATSPVRAYVLAHEHATGQVPTTSHVGTLHTEVRT